MSKDNGTATATQKEAVKQTPTPPPAVKLEHTEPPAKLQKVQPLEERLDRLSQLVELRGKYERLQKSGEKLEKFSLKKGEENITLQIEEDGNRETFTTSNPVIIAEVLAFLRETIHNKRKEIEPQINW